MTIELDYVEAAMVACPRCRAAVGKPCVYRGCKNGYAGCTYAVCARWYERDQPHLERAVAARKAALSAVPAARGAENKEAAGDA